MTKASSRTNLMNRSIPAILAVGSSLAALPASALQLGDLTVQSRLGQPLRASIAYALAPNEQLSDYCVTMRPGPSVSGLPGFGAATIRVANGVILLTGKAPVREPMISAHVVVNCPYSANLSREYMLFIDPLPSAYEQTAVARQPDPVAEPNTILPVAKRRPVPSVNSQPVNKDISASTRYRVQAGESLSTIAQRIQNRPVGLWPAVNAIFAANPDAFMHNDPNQLKAGSWILIPSFDGQAATITAAQPVAESVVEVAGPASDDSAAYEPAAVVATAPAEQPVAREEPVTHMNPVADMTSDLQPGDIILDSQLEGPTTTSSSPNVPTAVITRKTPATNGAASPSWFIWLAGGGIALILGLLMFGRRLRGHSSTAPGELMADPAQRRRVSDTQTTDTENVEAFGVDYDLSDDSPTEENLALDADLVIGTGLEHGSESDIVTNFGRTATAELDIELPFEPIAQAPDATDILPPQRTDEYSILESEILPEDDDYDMSVLVDATKMPSAEDVTELDLKAIEVDTDDEVLIAQNYTINKEVDYQVLAQDYEEEMTATQALNQEIAQAAAEIAERMEDGGDNNETTALPLASVTELDITAQMPAQNDKISDLEDTGVNEAITVNTVADDETVEMPAESGKARS